MSEYVVRSDFDFKSLLVRNGVPAVLTAALVGLLEELSVRLDTAKPGYTRSRQVPVHYADGTHITWAVKVVLDIVLDNPDGECSWVDIYFYTFDELGRKHQRLEMDIPTHMIYVDISDDEEVSEDED